MMMMVEKKQEKEKIILFNSSRFLIPEKHDPRYKVLLLLFHILSLCVVRMLMPLHHLDNDNNVNINPNSTNNKFLPNDFPIVVVVIHPLFRNILKIDQHRFKKFRKRCRW